MRGNNSRDEPIIECGISIRYKGWGSGDNVRKVWRYQRV